ncbi:MAG: hypothetical protein KH828_04660 [Clostridiales bacterium]|nr:hypothetical protein [Clostridiales bacterium]
MQKRKGMKWITASAAAYLLPALSVFLLPISRKQDSSGLTTAGYLTGAVFWTGILLGVVFFSVSWRKVRVNHDYQKWKKKRNPGVAAFFRTRGGIIADSCFILSFSALILSDYILGLPTVVVLVFMSLTLYSFCLHFLLNGRVYRYLLTLKKKKERGNEKEL